MAGKKSKREMGPAKSGWLTSVRFVPFLALALNFGWRAVISSGSIPYLRWGSFVGFGPLDKLFSLHAMQLAVMAPINPPFFIGAVSSIYACAMIPLVESYRHPMNSLFSSQTWVSLASQILGRGVVFPVWWTGFINAGGMRAKPDESNGAHIHPYDAEGILAANILGFVVPALMMSLTKQSTWSFVWWLYPISYTLIPRAWKSLRSLFSGEIPDSKVVADKKLQDRAYLIIQFLYLTAFVYATTMHLSVVIPRLFHPPLLEALFGVSFSIPSPEDKVSIPRIAYQFIQWDAMALFGSSIVATLSLGRTAGEKIKLALWGLLATLVCGSGGTMAGVWAWRERRLYNERLTRNS
ncbi:hypothetical protein C0991_009528 [Blastosporella zonata]|nr:hypothetical protein C0991_009528 [Blastosporella zonata]